MIGDRIYLDDQGGRVMQVLSSDVSPTLMQNAGKAHALIFVNRGLRFVHSPKTQGKRYVTLVMLAGASPLNLEHIRQLMYA